ncbi:MAG: hypothetical protein Q4D26_04790 [Clostridia bacterium]|nr:hypothetical protein [Clostridia bacterium]
MEKKIDFNRAIYLIMAVLLVVIILTAVFIAVSNGKGADSAGEGATDTNRFVTEFNKNTEAKISEIEKGDLPSPEELNSVSLDNVMQTDSINEQFNLSNYQINDGSIKYNYLANAVTSGERLSVTAKAMTEEEYNEMLPKQRGESNTIDDISVVYNDRSLYYTTEGGELPSNISESEEKGTVVVRYGNSLSELLPMQQMMWYADGIGYTLESIGRNYTYDDMAKLTEDFFNKVK